jgi:hypothetical protein
VALATAQLAAAVLALGRPDPASALALLQSGPPTAATALGTAALLTWTVVVTWTGYGLLAAVRATRSALGQPRVREVTFLGIGLLLLLAGTVRHFTYQVPMSGGSVQEARIAIAR